jgi:hypothetical protein
VVLVLELLPRPIHTVPHGRLPLQTHKHQQELLHGLELEPLHGLLPTVLHPVSHPLLVVVNSIARPTKRF